MQMSCFLTALMTSIFGFYISNVFALSPESEPIQIANAGFEDTTGQTPFNEFTFGIPVGWTLFDPHGVSGPDVFTGTLLPNGVDFFDGTAPEGERVAILFNSGREGEGEYGFQQTISEIWMPNTHYELSVQVGNIASGVAQNGQFFNLDEFPGYQVQLLAGNTIVAVDDNSLVIAEGQFAKSNLELITGNSEPFIGENISIRLINLNLIPDGFDQETSPDLEVDFDAIEFCATPISEPGDVNGDGAIDLLDIQPFIDAIAAGNYIPAADINQDGVVDLQDVAPFIALLGSG